MKTENGTDPEPPKELVEGEDFYIEEGLMVLTAKFLKERGYCCGNGCRHCPYNGDERSGSTEGKLPTHSG